ncbi:hypothetical protein CLIM01_03807 [Colletotrichum limetticola]|uniref:Uncharacterized protein n=1 Tax=Colletotrichum limetticola TaxID=1209924 RepID=A0ABQ9Q569_9PEZI|nr:hypothetical protein CLIM01_03807 [Colletotrichum limetticola]
MPDVHFQGVQTARLVCSSVPSKTPATPADHNPTQPSCSSDPFVEDRPRTGPLGRCVWLRPCGPNADCRLHSTSVSNLPAQVMTALVGLPAEAKCLGYLSQTLAQLTCASIYPPTV